MAKMKQRNFILKKNIFGAQGGAKYTLKAKIIEISGLYVRWTISITVTRDFSVKSFAPIK